MVTIKFSGWTPQTSKRAIVGPGVLVANITETLLKPSTAFNDAAAQAVIESGEVLGATDDGLEFSMEPEYSEWEFAGVGSNVRGGRRLLSVTCTVSGSFTEMTPDNIKKFVPFARTADWMNTATTPAKLGSVVSFEPSLVDADYLDNLALIGEYNGTPTPIVIMIYNALNAEGFTLGLNGDEDRSSTDVEFTATYGEQTYDATTGRFSVPAKIYLPDEAVVAP